MQIVKVVALALVVGVSAGSVKAEDEAPKSKSPDAALTATLPKIRKALELKMFDYQSARFLDVKAATGENGLTVFCGYLNAKNRDGGYTGYKKFLLLNEFILVETPMPWKTSDEAEENSMRRAFCGDDSKPIAENIKSGSVSLRDWTADLQSKPH